MRPRPIYGELDIVKKKFYQYEICFKGFKGVDEDKLRNIDALIEEYKQEDVKNNIGYISFGNNTQEYARLLVYLTGRADLSWDDKMLFVIRFYDPELKLLDLYLETYSIDNNAIKNESNAYIKEDLINKKNKIDLEFANKCRSLIKIYDPGIIKYEKKLFKALKSNGLKFGIKKDYLTAFFESYVTPNTDLRVTDDELKRIIEDAREYKKRYGLPTINDLAFQLTQQRIGIGIKSAKKAMIFMIYTLDEEFKAFHIFDEYGNWNEIQKMCFAELGFYNKNFVNNEIKFDRVNHDTSTTLSLFPDPRINQ